MSRRRAAPNLMAEGEKLPEVRFTNIQFTGDYLARRPETRTNVRVIREVTPARIDLAFLQVLGTGGEVLTGGHARAAQQRATPTLAGGVDPSDPLLYEKASARGLAAGGAAAT